METRLFGRVTCTDSDADLVGRMARGDEEALRTIYATYGRRLYAYAWRITGSATLAEEVLQDSLLAAWKGASKYRSEGRVIAWLLGIVHRQALNATRRKSWSSTSLDDAEEVGALPPEPATDLEGGIDRERALASAMAELTSEHRIVLELVFYHGLTMAEAATICQCPVGTIKSRLSYAKVRLRSVLESAGVAGEDLL